MSFFCLFLVYLAVATHRTQGDSQKEKTRASERASQQASKRASKSNECVKQAIAFQYEASSNLSGNWQAGFPSPLPSLDQGCKPLARLALGARRANVTNVGLLELIPLLPHFGGALKSTTRALMVTGGLKALCLSQPYCRVIRGIHAAKFMPSREMIELRKELTRSSRLILKPGCMTASLSKKEA